MNINHICLLFILHAFALKYMKPYSMCASMYVPIPVLMKFWVVLYFFFFATTNTCAKIFYSLVLENASAHTYLLYVFLSCPAIHQYCISQVLLQLGGAVWQLSGQCSMNRRGVHQIANSKKSTHAQPCSLSPSQKDLKCGIGLSVKHGKGSATRD